MTYVVLVEVERGVTVTVTTVIVFVTVTITCWNRPCQPLYGSWAILMLTAATIFARASTAAIANLEKSMLGVLGKYKR